MESNKFLKSNYILSIIIPVYNNEESYINNCFNSLKKSTIFNKMELIFVDDGSTNQSSIDAVKHLESMYTNIKTYFFEKGGSGSASRPRNKGVEIATSKYISYLDSDNEAIGDGYYALYKSIEKFDVDIAIGNIISKSNSKEEKYNYYNEFTKINDNNFISTNGRKILSETNFLAQSIQACLIKKEFLSKNNLKMIDGAIGEDTLFFYEMLVHSKKVMVVDKYIHIYNTDVTNSITNSIDISYFKKHLLIEKHKVRFLKKFKLFNEYKENICSYYLDRWIKSKLKHVSKDKINECTNIVNTIEDLYNYIFSIIIPVFNIDISSLKRCFTSISKLSLFDKIEILIIDDGSSKIDTIEYLQMLDKNYQNVKTYFFEKGGSGSASRPRNKGIELATTKYITFLDPDNEAFEDGYIKLYEKMLKHNCDLIIGNIYFDDNGKRCINDYYSYVPKSISNFPVITNTRDLLLKTVFMAQSIQACLISREIIINNNLRMIEGAIGEDTLFFYELVLASNNILVSNDIVHIYYRKNSNSILNKIDISYFEKMFIGEVKKQQFFKQNGLINNYLEKRYTINLNDYFISKLEYLKSHEREMAENIINEIRKLNDK